MEEAWKMKFLHKKTPSFSWRISRLSSCNPIVSLHSFKMNIDFEVQIYMARTVIYTIET